VDSEKDACCLLLVKLVPAFNQLLLRKLARVCGTLFCRCFTWNSQSICIFGGL